MSALSGVNENLRGIVLFGLAFFIAGLVMVAIRWYANNEMEQLSVELDDVLVVKVEPEKVGRKGKRRTVYRPYFKFTTEDGRTVVAKSMNTFPTNSHPEGSYVTIRYDPNDPENRAVVAGTGYESETTDAFSLIVVGFGAFWIVVGAIVIAIKQGISKRAQAG